MKTVLINRAVPGSGKTTSAKNIFATVSAAGLTIAFHSTDEYFMRKHIADFNNYNELLDKNAVPNPARHFNYRWDEYLQDVVRVSTPVKPFDYDTLIQITPETYHVLKDKIGREILSLMSR